MEAMRAAFYRVCDVLQLSCDREDPLTEVVVKKIVELAKAGERDPEILCFTIAELDMPLQEAIPRSSPKVASVAQAHEPDYACAVAGASLRPGGLEPNARSRQFDRTCKRLKTTASTPKSVAPWLDARGLRKSATCY
jgi:hypothetical protein